jgi:putative restriction endonuclease
MNVQPRVPMDKETFLAWVQGHEGRFELVERHVVMTVGGAKTHALIAGQLMRALWERIDVTKWVVLGSDLAVDVGPGSLRYPDAIMDCIGGQRALVATAPVLIAEVSFTVIRDTRPRRQGRGVSPATNSRGLSCSVAGRDQGVGLSEGRGPTPRPEGDLRGECCDQSRGARNRPAAYGNLCRHRVRQRAISLP